MLLTDAVMDAGEIKSESNERFFVPAMDPERGLQPRICDRLICADDIPEEYLTLISLSAKGLYQMTTQEEKGPD